MQPTTRFAVVAAGALAALAATGSALAAYTPRFIVNHTPYSVASARTTITMQIPHGDDATARVVFYAAPGYRGVLGQAAGTRVGTVAATMLATRTSPSAAVSLSGAIVTDSPARHTGNRCAPGSHRAIWILRLAGGGQSFNVPVYLDVPTGREASFSRFKFQLCLASPHIPPGQGGAPAGAQLLTMRLQLDRGVLAAPITQGRYVWPAFFTPYPAGSGTANTAATVQSRAIVQLRGQATVRARYLRRTKTFRLSGSVTEFRIGVGGATVEIWKGLRPSRLARVSRTRTAPNGRWATAGRLQPRRRTYFRVRVVVPNRQVSVRGCAISVPNLPLTGGGCVSAVYSGFITQSRVISLRV
jgi:hypothetical protein